VEPGSASFDFQKKGNEQRFSYPVWLHALGFKGFFILHSLKTAGDK